MHYLLVAVEGETEKELLNAFLKTRIGQAPEKYGQIEVVPISVGGNHGYTRLVETASAKIDQYLVNPENCYEPVYDKVEKWLVFDYDDIEKKNITLKELITKARAAGFSCTVSRPNIEFFILSLLKGHNFAARTHQSNYGQEINRAINLLNRVAAAKMPNYSAVTRIPPYNKKAHQCRACLWMLFASHPELIDATIKQAKLGDNLCYSELPRLLKRILDILNGRALV